MYTEKINANMQHLGTEMSEWSAGTAFCDPESGEVRFGIPEDYTHANTLYSTDATCELCGHKIKHGYVITHEVKKLWMIVGSECVHHFGTKTGKQIENDAVYAAAEEFYFSVFNAIRESKTAASYAGMTAENTVVVNQLSELFPQKPYTRKQPKTNILKAWDNRDAIRDLLPRLVRRTA